MGEKSRVTAILLAFFLGFLGVHKFYLGQVRKGLLYILFSCTGLSCFLAWIDVVKFLTWSDEKFQEYVLANIRKI